MTTPPDGGHPLLRLRRRAQRRVGDRALGTIHLGIIAMERAPAGPAARIAVIDDTSGTATAHTVRPGTELRAGAWTLAFAEVVDAGVHGYVTFTARPAAAPDA